MKLDSPEACVRRFSECLSRADLDGVVDVFDERAVFVDEERVLCGRADIRATLAPFFTAGARLAMELRRLIPVGDDLAVVHHDWHGQVPGADGLLVPNAGRSVQLLRRRGDGSWRIVFDEPNRPTDEH